MKELYDMHCHIVPGVDDGACDMKMSVRMLQKEYEDGVRCIIATPHFRYDMFEPSQQLILHNFLKLKEKAEEIGEEGIQMYLGCELHASVDMAERLKKKERRSMAGSRYVLVEFGTLDEKSYIMDRIHDLVRNGYYPIIAHAERYQAVAKGGVRFLELLREAGAYIQLNADSITGAEGFFTKRFCKKVIKAGMLDFVGSDGHDMETRIPNIKGAYEKLKKIAGEETAQKIMAEHPDCVIKNQKIHYENSGR